MLFQVSLVELIKKNKGKRVNIDKAIISVHCHNDLGLAVSNSLNAIIEWCSSG